MADAEMRIFLHEAEIPNELIRTGWYLHGVASANEALELYPRTRQRQAFEVSAHIFDLALNDEGRSRQEKLELAFGAQIGFRRALLDPNATAIFTRVGDLLVSEPPVERHIESLAVEAGVALLGFQTRLLFDLYSTWLRQLAAVLRQARVDDLWGTPFGPPQRVVDACRALLNFLAFGDEAQAERARALLTAVVHDPRAAGDLDAQWVAAHLLDFADDAAQASVWRLLPPDVPSVARQAFTLAAPPVLTLWEPQQKLFSARAGRDPLAETTRRLVLSIPTSSGKTLLAQLIVVTHLAREAGGVCYVAPLRSLGREVRRALRNRLRVLAKEMGVELPDYSPWDRFLANLGSGNHSIEEIAEATGEIPGLLGLLADLGDGPRLPDVEVMTPERLAHLLRNDAEGVLERFRLFVFDEAQLLGEQARGFNLEAILSYLHWQTRMTDHRIVLLSAALGNEGQIMSWLDPNDEGVLVRSAWRGPRRLHAVFTTDAVWDEGVETTVRSQDWPLRITYPLRGKLRVRAAAGTEPRSLELTEKVGDLALRYDARRNPRRYQRRKRDGTFEPVGPKDDAPHSTQQYKMAARMVAALGSFGAILVVMSTRRIAQDMARELAGLLEPDPRAAPLVDFARQRLGEAHPLVSVLRHGVAFHHAALPLDVLEELEDALRDGVVRFMTCTSTLTEGVNLPVRTVVLAETRREDAEALLTGARLINAMGRAGRAGKESEGWIVLVRADKERASDFDLMAPEREELAVVSRLTTDAALEAMAQFEDAVRAGEDATFLFGATEMNDFLSFIWFVLSSEEERGRPPNQVDVGAALDSTLAFTQLDLPRRKRWAAVAEHVRASYGAADPEQRRRWAHAGTSVGTARRLDDLADIVVTTVNAYAEAHGDAAAELLGRPSEALGMLGTTGILNRLLDLPENEHPWRFRASRSGQSTAIEIDPARLLQAWVSGTPIPDLADAFIPDDVPQDWRVEQIVDAITQHFEHFLSWMLGVLLELSNARLQAAEDSTVRVCEELSAYVRYGVDSRIALLLLLSGVRSRRLAHNVASQANTEGVHAPGVRAWLSSMQIGELRSRFNATSSEMLDLLEYARTPRTSVLRNLLEDGRTELEVELTEHAADEQPVAAAPSDEEPAVSSTPVVVAPVPGEEQPPRLGIFSSDQRLVAIVPTSAYGDVQAILDTGVPTVALLSKATLELTLASEGT